ncbi:MAG: tyrosine-protein phosphatase [Atopobiaceae bacterium]|nr:tyrosine-protein phosphatase [Atopobiaceae bacterium]
MDENALPGAIVGFPSRMGVRDLGGLRGANGRPVRHGLLYRGSALIGLTEDQRDIVDDMGLALILDLRAAGELEGRPDYVPNGCEYVRISGMYDEDSEEVDFSPTGMLRIMERIQNNPVGFMRGLYASMKFQNPAVHELVDCLVREQVPLFFHCTAGKDRTGVCAAVVLMLLGVPDDEIVREFLLTNEYRSEIIHMSPEELPGSISENDRLNWAKINSVNEADLRYALDAVDERYGSREEYFEAEFGLDEGKLRALRDRYLVSPDMPMIPVPVAHRMLDTPFVKVYDLVYADGTHYYDASRRDYVNLRALKKDREQIKLIPDAVSCCLVLSPEGQEPRLVMFYEYRYPTGQYVLGIPSGLVDQQDCKKRNPLVAAMVREVYEETGIAFGNKDSIRVVNPLLFNSPGMTDESTALLCAIIRGTDATSLSQAGASGMERFGKFELVTREEAWEILRRGCDRYGRPFPMVTWAALTYFATDQWKNS